MLLVHDCIPSAAKRNQKRTVSWVSKLDEKKQLNDTLWIFWNILTMTLLKRQGQVTTDALVFMWQLDHEIKEKKSWLLLALKDKDYFRLWSMFKIIKWYMLSDPWWLDWQLKYNVTGGANENHNRVKYSLSFQYVGHFCNSISIYVTSFPKYPWSNFLSMKLSLKDSLHIYTWVKWTHFFW